MVTDHQSRSYSRAQSAITRHNPYKSYPILTHPILVMTMITHRIFHSHTPNTVHHHYTSHIQNDQDTTMNPTMLRSHYKRLYIRTCHHTPIYACSRLFPPDHPSTPTRPVPYPCLSLFPSRAGCQLQASHPHDSSTTPRLQVCDDPSPPANPRFWGSLSLKFD